MGLNLLSFDGKVKWIGNVEEMRTYDKWERALFYNPEHKNL